MAEEIWRGVVGFADTHEVSNLGRFRVLERSVPNGRGDRLIRMKVLTLRPIRGGYLRATISLGGSQILVPVHRLVADAFLGAAPSPLHQINHIDGDKTNNRADNLEWCTAQENSQHAYETGLSVSVKGSQHGRAKLTEAQIAEIRALAGVMTQRDIAARFGVKQPQVQRIIAGKRWAHLV